MNSSAEVFEAHRPTLVSLAYRMLGDFGRAEELVQEAWLRWAPRSDAVAAPKPYLVKLVTRLCLNELASARARKEESRTRLPEPVSADESGLSPVEMLDQVSMAFLVVLQRLTAAERAALLLHDVFELEHTEIARLLQKTEPACRQLLRRAREEVMAERRVLSVSREEHERLLRAFVEASTRGDVAALSAVLAEDVVLIADAGPEGGRFGRVRNLPRPVSGRAKVAAFAAAVTPQGSGGLSLHERELNGQPAVVVMRGDEPVAVIMIAASRGEIRSIFVQADARRLQRSARATRE